MTSSHIVADNLAAAGDLLREAKDLGCDIACLPENFSFIGLRDADKLQVAEPDREGPVQAFLSDTAAKTTIVSCAARRAGASRTRPAISASRASMRFS